MSFVQLLMIGLVIIYIILALWIISGHREIKHLVIAWTLAFVAMGIIACIVSYNIKVITKQISHAKHLECFKGHLVDNGRPVVDLARIPVHCYTTNPVVSK